MKKIQCPECGRVKGENDKHCLDCGYVFDSVKKEEKIVQQAEPVKEVKSTPKTEVKEVKKQPVQEMWHAQLFSSTDKAFSITFFDKSVLEILRVMLKVSLRYLSKPLR